MTRDEFIAAHPIERELEGRGIPFLGNGPRKMVKCPFHEDKTASMSVDTVKGLWNCFAGCGGGSVIDLIAKLDGISIGDVLKRNGHVPTPIRRTATATATAQEAILEKTYSYQDAFGKEVYQVLRFKPKTFRQRSRAGDKWAWSMEGVERVLYRLPEVIKASTVAIAEGEKDADTITSLGWCGTAHVGGVKNWLEAYAEELKGKELLIFHDNDKAGEEWRDEVFSACAGKCKTVRIISVPKTFKDVSDYVAGFKTKEEATRAIISLIELSHPFIAGVRMPIYTMAELEAVYSRHCLSGETDALDLSKWLPSFNRIRKIFPGELVLIIGDTGTGKTAVITSIANAADPLPTLVFELELPPEIMFERNVAARMKSWTCRQIEDNYSTGEMLGAESLNKAFPHIFMCFESKLTTADLETIIFKSELKIGQKPKLVLLDYVQLVAGAGSSRYEKVSQIAEQLRVIAKATRTIIVVVSQVNRESAGDEIGLHSAKDSGSLENSSSLVLGIWRDESDATLMNLKILKSTKGGAGLLIQCNYHGDRMQLTERSQFEPTT